MQIGNLELDGDYEGMWSLTGESNKETGHCDLQITARSTFGFILSTFRKTSAGHESEKYEVCRYFVRLST